MSYQNKKYKSRLIKKRGHKCEQCKRTKWMGKLIPLEIDHIDGNPFEVPLPRVGVSCRTTYEKLKTQIKEMGYSATARIYNVSDNCVRKWLKTYDRESKLATYRQKNLMIIGSW